MSSTSGQRLAAHMFLCKKKPTTDMWSREDAVQYFSMLGLKSEIGSRKTVATNSILKSNTKSTALVSFRYCDGIVTRVEYDSEEKK